MNARGSLLALLLTLNTTTALAEEPTAWDAAIDHRVFADTATDPAAARPAYEASVVAFTAHLAAHPNDAKARWYLADTLFTIGRYDEAMRAYGALLAEPNHPYVDGATFQRMRTAHKRLQAQYGGTDTVPEGAEMLSRRGNVVIYALSADHRDFIEAANVALRWTFTTSLEEPNVYQEAMEQNRPALAYLAAEVLFHHHHFDEARQRLFGIIDAHPHSVEASYSAGLVVDSYALENDLEKVRLYTNRFIANPVGPPDPSFTQERAFAQVNESATFKRCLAQEDDEQHHEAMACFLDFLADFPSSQNADLALYNAAISAVGADDPGAQELLGAFLSQHPHHVLVPAARSHLSPAVPSP